jgi:hypothetical protein
MTRSFIAALAIVALVAGAGCKGEPYRDLTGVRNVPAPTTLTATLTSEGTVQMSWTAGGSGVDHYNVLRASGDVGAIYFFSKIGTTTGTTYTHAPDDNFPLESGQTYSYEVVAAANGEVSNRSNRVVITVP